MGDQAAISMRLPGPDRTDRVYGAGLTLAVAMLMVVMHPQLLHWFILPVILCGILVASDTVAWLRGKVDPFDPRGLIGLMGFHFFFTAPLMVAAWDIHIWYVRSPLDDFRPWMGRMASLNAVGLFFYYGVQAYVSKRPYRRQPTVWQINEQGAAGLLGFIFLLSVCSYLFVLYMQGGISAIISHEIRVRSGLGVFKMMGRVAPIMLLFWLTVLRQRQTTRRATLISLGILLVALFLFQMFTGGLVGSRSRTVWAVFYMVGILHFFWRRMTVKVLLAGFLVLMGFMYLYGFYKTLGARGVRRIMAGESIARLEKESGRTWRGMMIGDLSRADVQAYLLYVMVDKPHPYRYCHGETYFGHLLGKVPVWVARNRYNVRAAIKTSAGSDLLWGSDHPPGWLGTASRVYGMAGEAMLNFGPWAAPFPFLIWGWLVGRYRRGYYRWLRLGDTRLFIAPILATLMVILLSSDSDNVLYFLQLGVVFPVIVTRLISIRVRSAPEQETFYTLAGPGCSSA